VLQNEGKPANEKSRAVKIDDGGKAVGPDVGVCGFCHGEHESRGSQEAGKKE
jgi:cytochrome c553